MARPVATTSLPLDAAFVLTTPGGLALAVDELPAPTFEGSPFRSHKLVAASIDTSSLAPTAAAAAWQASETVEAVAGAGPSSSTVSQLARCTWVAIPTAQATVFVSGTGRARGDEGDRCMLWNPALDARLDLELGVASPAALSAYVWAWSRLHNPRNGGWLWRPLPGGNGKQGQLLAEKGGQLYALAARETADGESGWRLAKLTENGVEGVEEAATHFACHRREWMGACDYRSYVWTLICREITVVQSTCLILRFFLCPHQATTRRSLTTTRTTPRAWATRPRTASPRPSSW